MLSLPVYVPEDVPVHPSYVVFRSGNECEVTHANLTLTSEHLIRRSCSSKWHAIVRLIEYFATFQFHCRDARFNQCFVTNMPLEYRSIDKFGQHIVKSSYIKPNDVLLESNYTVSKKIHPHLRQRHFKLFVLGKSFLVSSK